MRFVASLVAAGCVLLGAHHASAAIFKCTNAQGQVSFQEQPCPNNSASKVLEVKGSRQLTIEEKAWMDERSQMFNGMCNEYAARRYGQQELLRQACACATQRFFANSIAKLRELEKNDDMQGYRELTRVAVESCRKEIGPQQAQR